MVVDEDDDNDGGTDGASHVSIQPDAPESEESSWPSSAMSSISQHGKKCKHNAGASLPSLGPPPPPVKGSSFWSMVEKWFAAHMQSDQLGISWSTLRWTKYVQFLHFDCFSISDTIGV